MCNLYSITTNQEAIRALFRVMNRYVGNLAPMPGVFPDYPAPVVRNVGNERELVDALGMPPPLRTRGPPVTNIRNTSSPHWRGWLKPETAWRALLSVVDPTERSTFVRSFVNSRAFIEGSGRPDILAIGEGLKSPLTS